MKTELGLRLDQAAPIVALLDGDLPHRLPTAQPRAEETTDPVRRARAFAEPLLADHLLGTGEPALAHADGVAAILAGV
ncbi:MAG TPA: GTP pyrophosphokinase, partial [Roseateles sp.]